MSRPTFIERFLAKFKQTEGDGCWLWEGAKNPDGYGRIKDPDRRDRQLRAHRVSYEHFRHKIPAGLVVCHKCDVRLCVNPNHLFIGTHADNVADKVSKGRCGANERRGEGASRAKLTNKQANEIINDPRKCSDVARAYGVSMSTIYSVRKGLSYFTHTNQRPISLDEGHQ